MGFSELFALDAPGTPKCPKVLLDGGLGTTLEDVFHKDLAHPLWSARLVDEDEESIIAAHLAFLRAGSQVILTSSYQAAYDTFRRANYADSEAERLMRKSVHLAVEACRRHELETCSGVSSRARRTYVALSLGPYGATVEDAAEFSGKYPPPYGPASPSYSALQGLIPISEDRSYEDALAAFHFSRLLVYAREADTWDAIDIVAFETVPLVTEAKAIRRAVARLDCWFQEMMQRADDSRPRGRKMKPWYITFVFPGPRGEFPQYCCNENLEHPGLVGNLNECRRYTPSEVVKAAFLQEGGGYMKMAMPDAIGINCTKIPEIFQIMDEFISTTKALGTQSCFGGELPWLVLLPNGGLAYDTIERTWVNDDPNSQVDPVPLSREWGLSIGEKLGRDVDHSPQWARVFGGLLIGGCCKVSPNEIQTLKEVLSM